MKRKYYLPQIMILICMMVLSACGKTNAGTGELDTLINIARRDGNLGDKAQDYEGIRDRCQENVENGGAALDTYLYYGEALAWLEDSTADLKEALNAYKEVNRMDPENEEAIMGMADVYIRLEEYDKAEHTLEKLVNVNDEERQEKLLEFETAKSGYVQLRDNNDNVRKVSYYEDGVCTQYVIVKYNRGKKEKAIYYLKDGSVAKTVDYRYDGSGNELNGFAAMEGGFKFTELEYNEEGYCSDKLSYYPNGELFCEEKYTYYDDGNEKSYWCKYESMLFSTAIEYDTEGRKTKITSYDVNNEVEDYTVYEYEDTLDREIHYDAGGNIRFSYETEYDEDHKWISETKYDADGNIIEQRKNTQNQV